MRLLYRLFNRIIHSFLPARQSRPEDIPSQLSEEVLAEAIREASFLHDKHAIDVADVPTDEVAGLPRRADR